MEENKDLNLENDEIKSDDDSTDKEAILEDVNLNNLKSEDKTKKEKNKVLKAIGSTIIDAAIIGIISFLVYSLKGGLKVFGLQVVSGSEVEFFMMLMLILTFVYYIICRSIKSSKSIGEILL